MEKTYYNITKELIEKAKSHPKVQELKLDFANSGNVSYMGIKIQYDYNEEKESSTVKILKKPFIMPYSVIWKIFDEIITKLKN